MTLGAGSLIGTNIVLERELGHGAMGTVWLAENRSLGAKVAVKVLPIAMTDNGEAVQRFQQEARAAAQIDTPHVVKTYDFGITAGGQPYIVMELLRGRELREEIEARGSLPPSEVAVIVRQMCVALSRAHALGLVHRDIKPANIYLLESGGEPFVKVLDFGIACFINDQNLGMTETGALMGTPYYMSPEQFVDPRKIDHRSDLWSATVVIYGCLLGTLPFLGETVGALTLAVHAGSFTPPTQLLPGLPIALDAFFARALQVDPNLRYGNAEELATAFEAAIQSATTTTAPAVMPVTQVPSQPLVATAPARAPLGPSAASVAPTPASFAQTSPPAPAKKSTGLWVGILLAVFGLGALAAAFVAMSAGGDESRTNKSAQTDTSKTPGKKNKQKKKKKKKKADDDGDESSSAVAPSAAPTASATATPSAEPTASASAAAPPPPPVPRPPTRSKWRARKMTCAKYPKGKSCAKCCVAGDIMKPYPSCECFFDGEKWDREHGRAP